MRITDTPLHGVHLLDAEPARDERGWFVRTFDRSALAEAGLPVELDVVAVSFNEHVHTLRGMHYQRSPHEEVKLVRCSRGAVFDVVVDLRPESPSFRRWCGMELTEAAFRVLHVPAGCAHGFLTLAPRSEVTYHLSGTYAPASAAGVRWDDPAVGIDWPARPQVISDRDAGYPLLPVATPPA